LGRRRRGGVSLFGYRTFSNIRLPTTRKFYRTLKHANIKKKLFYIANIIFFIKSQNSEDQLSSFYDNWWMCCSAAGDISWPEVYASYLY
jgi:hypothetical protein